MLHTVMLSYSLKFYTYLPATKVIIGSYWSACSVAVQYELRSNLRYRQACDSIPEIKFSQVGWVRLQNCAKRIEYIEVKARLASMQCLQALKCLQLTWSSKCHARNFVMPRSESCNSVVFAGKGGFAVSLSCQAYSLI